MVLTGEKRAAAKTRLLLADDHLSVLEQICQILETRFDVIGIVTNGSDLVERARELQPDVIITDLAMPKLNGIDAARTILSFLPSAVIIALSTYKHAALVNTALSMGMRGYVLKEAAAEDLVPAIDTALTGQSFVSKAIDCG